MVHRDSCERFRFDLPLVDNASVIGHKWANCRRDDWSEGDNAADQDQYNHLWRSAHDVMRREFITGFAFGSVLGTIGFLRIGLWPCLATCMAHIGYSWL